jgi:ACS family tartrate transporter-like MFS transporter
VTSIQDATDYQHATIRRITWRLIPFMMLLYFIAFIDRQNVGFAATTMNVNLGISEAVFGFGAGAFFLGYFLFEVPSNLLLHRFGARLWIARIMITWGLISGATAFVVGARSYIAVRILLGVAEAGFFPGMILYLTYWFPAATRARMTALFVAAIPISGIIGAPVSGYLLDMNQVGGLHGWQWMFLLEAVPALLIGLIVPFYLTDRPKHARWLRPEQIDWLEKTLEGESRQKPHLPLLRALVLPSILALSSVYFCMMVGLYGLSFFMPKVLHEVGTTADEMKWVAALPPACGALLMFFWGQHSDRTGEREWHTAAALFLGALGFSLAALVANKTIAAQFAPVVNQSLTVLGFILVAIGIYSGMATFWPLPSMRLSGTAAAGGIAVVNSIGNLGGFVGPSTIGALKDTRFGYTGGLLVTGVLMALGAVLVVVTKSRASEVGS